MSDPVKDAEKYVKGNKPADVHPDVAARMVGFERAQKMGRSAATVLAEARALLDAVKVLGDDNVPTTAIEAAAPVARKRAPAKKAAAPRSRS